MCDGSSCGPEGHCRGSSEWWFHRTAMTDTHMMMNIVSFFTVSLHNLLDTLKMDSVTNHVGVKGAICRMRSALKIVSNNKP